MSIPKGSSSALFQPLSIGNGKITLKHRIVLAPLTRNRGVPVHKDLPGKPNRVWISDDLVAEYYSQRTTEGGLLISEGIHPSLEAGANPGVPGLFTSEHETSWRKVVDVVHQKGGYIYAQLWHAGRVAVSLFTGVSTISASPTAWETDQHCRLVPPGCETTVAYKDFPPIGLSIDQIHRVIDDYVRAAQMATRCGFDGVEIHGGNGYLPEQFLSSNINRRTDEYGGSPEKRCKFPLDLMTTLADTIGEENVAIRLSPFGLFNETRGEKRLETWKYLCKGLKKKIPGISYIHFIEPRFEQILSVQEKDKFLASWGIPDINLQPFRDIMGSTPLISAGGWNDSNCWGAVESGKYDALAFGRWFISNPDLVVRLREGKPLRSYDRGRFYGPFPADREIGYTDYPYYNYQET